MSEIEDNQAALRANIQQSQRLIDKSCELLEKHRNGREATTARNGTNRAAS